MTFTMAGYQYNRPRAKKLQECFGHAAYSDLLRVVVIGELAYSGRPICESISR